MRSVAALLFAGAGVALAAEETFLPDYSIGETDEYAREWEEKTFKNYDDIDRAMFEGREPMPVDDAVQQPAWLITPTEFHNKKYTAKSLKKYIRSLQWQPKLMSQNWITMQRFNKKNIDTWKEDRKFFKKAIKMIRYDSKKLAYCELARTDEGRDFMTDPKAAKSVMMVDDCGAYLDKEHAEYYRKTEFRRKLAAKWIGLSLMGNMKGEPVTKEQLVEQNTRKPWPQEMKDAWAKMPDGTVLMESQSKNVNIPHINRSMRRRMQQFDFQDSFDMAAFGQIVITINAQIIGGCPAAYLIIRHEWADWEELELGSLVEESIDLCEFSMDISRSLAGLIDVTIGVVGRFAGRVTCDSGLQGGCHKNKDTTVELPYATTQGMQFALTGSIEVPWWTGLDGWSGELELYCDPYIELFTPLAAIFNDDMYLAGFCPTLPAPKVVGGHLGAIEKDWISSEYGNNALWGDRTYSISNVGEFDMTFGSDPWMYMLRSTVGWRHTTYSVEVTAGTEIAVVTDNAHGMPGSGWGACDNSYKKSMPHSTTGNYHSCYIGMDLGAHFGNNRYHCKKGCQKKIVTEDGVVEFQGSSANKFVAFFRDSCQVHDTQSACEAVNYCGWEGNDWSSTLAPTRSDCRQKRVLNVSPEELSGHGQLVTGVHSVPWFDRTYSWTNTGFFSGADYSLRTSVNTRGDAYTFQAPAGYKVYVIYDNVNDAAISGSVDSFSGCTNAMSSSMRHANVYQGSNVCYAEYTAIGNHYCYKGCKMATMSANNVVTVDSHGSKTNVFLVAP